jgi:hypothetical protein
MKRLSSYPNVYNTCLVLLERSGFKLRLERATETWFAEKDNIVLQADNPIELLGLSAVTKDIPFSDDEYWWKIDEPNLLSLHDPE